MSFSTAALLNLGLRQPIVDRTASQSVVRFIDNSGTPRYGIGTENATQYGLGAVAQAVGACAYGAYANALDRGAVVIGLYARGVTGCFVGGDNASALKAESVVIGMRARSSVVQSVVIGPQCVVTEGGVGSGNAVAIGNKTYVAADLAVVVGALSNTANDDSVIVGPSSFLTLGDGTLGGVLIGSTNTGKGSIIAIGSLNSISPLLNYSIAIGWGLSSSQSNSFIVGRNGSITAANQFKIGTEAFPMKGFVFDEFTDDITDATTNVMTNNIVTTHRSSNVPLAGFGVSWLAKLESSTHVVRSAGQIGVVWQTPTNAAESADFVVRLMTAGAAHTERLRVLATGVLQFIIGGQAGRFTHANSATHTWTMPDADGNIVYQTAALTLNNFVYGGGGALAKDAGFNRGDIIKDTAFGPSWDNVADVSPSQNAVYDELVLILASIAAIIAATPSYTVTNVTTDRAYDANATTLDELADVVGTLIADLKLKAVIT